MECWSKHRDDKLVHSMSIAKSIALHVISIDWISEVGVPSARVTMFGGSAYEVLFICRNRLHYTTENNCQKLEVPGTITLKK
jgi:hypothetical protein